MNKNSYKEETIDCRVVDSNSHNDVPPRSSTMTVLRRRSYALVIILKLQTS